MSSGNRHKFPNFIHSMEAQTQQPKNKQLTTAEQLVNIIGVVAAVSTLVYVIRLIAKRTDTSIISDNARKVLENKDEALRLRKAIDTYHVTGDWEKTEIGDIL